GAHALRAGRAGRFVRSIRCVRGVFVDGVLPAPLVRVPETPPEPPFGSAALGRGSRLRDEPAEKFSGAAMAAVGQKGLPVIVWNIRFYAGITLMLALFLQTQREVNDETRSYYNRNCGHFGSDRLGGGGQCTIWRSGPSLRPCPSLRSCPSLRPCASLWPFSKICPSSLPSHCSSDLSRSDLSRRSPCGLCRWYGLHPWLRWAALCRYSSNICRTICPTE